MLNRFYAICNCCSCCCGAMHAHRAGTPMLISSGYVASVTGKDCVGCGACARICPFEALSVSDGIAHVDHEACMGCGVCVAACSKDALSLSLDPEKGMPLEMKDLLDTHATP